METKILITCPPMLKQIDSFKEKFDELNMSITTPEVLQTLTVDQLMDLVPLHDGWIIGDDPATAEVFKAGKSGYLKAAVKWGVNQFQDIVHIVSENDWFLLAASGILTLLMLFSIVKILKNMVLEKVEAFFDKYIFKTAIRAMGFGVILTILVQSSSITTSTVVPLAGAGVLTLRQIFPFTLGANIGTTVTALLAAMVLNPTAMIVAFSHLIFNIMGILFIYPIKPLRELPIKAATKLSDLSVKNKFVPLLYLVIVFVLIPLFIILIGG